MVAAAVVLAAAGPAFAHVTVDPASAPQGAEITLGFRVPNESRTRHRPDPDLLSRATIRSSGVDPESVPGWQDTIHTANLNPPSRPTTVCSPTMSARSTGPEGPSSRGTSRSSTSWPRACPPAPTRSCSRPCRPTPTGPSSGGSIRSAPPTPTRPTPRRSSGSRRPQARRRAGLRPPAATSGSDSTARTIGIIGLVVGALGLGAAVWALVIVRRSPGAERLSPLAASRRRPRGVAWSPGVLGRAAAPGAAGPSAPRLLGGLGLLGPRAARAPRPDGGCAGAASSWRAPGLLGPPGVLAGIRPGPRPVGLGLPDAPAGVWLRGGRVGAAGPRGGAVTGGGGPGGDGPGGSGPRRQRPGPARTGRHGPGVVPGGHGRARSPSSAGPSVRRPARRASLAAGSARAACRVSSSSRPASSLSD